MHRQARKEERQAVWGGGEVGVLGWGGVGGVRFWLLVRLVLYSTFMYAICSRKDGARMPVLCMLGARPENRLPARRQERQQPGGPAGLLAHAARL